MFRRLAKYGLAAAAVTSSLAYYHFNHSSSALPPIPHALREPIPNTAVPSRSAQLQRLKSSEVFDVFVIGGGSTGTGVALDGALRGLSVALVEREDFASGTTSKSTKLIHGGVRYLEKAILQLDQGQLHLVQDALRERKHLLAIAPHLSNPLPIILPLYQKWPDILFYAPYMYIGTKFYDFFAGKDGILVPSYWISRDEALKQFPNLKQRELKAGIVYYDGQHNDSRMCLGIALTAAAKGAAVANHVEVTGLLKDGDRVCGVKVKDRITGEEWDVKARSVVNATGPFCDSIRKMADPKTASLISPSSGVHIALSGAGPFSPPDMGLIIPKTEDGRVLFALPWEGSTIIGTTDAPSEITGRPKPHESEIQFILKEINKYLEKPVRREDVESAWSGIRPLAKDPNAKDTASTSRDHLIEVTAPGLITITGGKWTTYRKMAEDAIEKVLHLNAAEKQAGVNENHLIPASRHAPCNSLGVPLIGAAGYTSQDVDKLVGLGLDRDVATHLSHNYGDKAFDVAALIQSQPQLKTRLHPQYPFIEAEILYGIRHEMAETASDLLGNRTRIAYLNSDAAFLALPSVINWMSKELKWSSARQAAEFQSAAHFLQTMNFRPTKAMDLAVLKEKHSQVIATASSASSSFESRWKLHFPGYPDRDVRQLRAAFDALDTGKTGFLSTSQLAQLLAQIRVFGFSGAKTPAPLLKHALFQWNYRDPSVFESAVGVSIGESVESPGTVQGDATAYIREEIGEEKEKQLSWEEIAFGIANAQMCYKNKVQPKPY